MISAANCSGSPLPDACAGAALAADGALLSIRAARPHDLESLAALDGRLTRDVMITRTGAAPLTVVAFDGPDLAGAASCRPAGAGESTAEVVLTVAARHRNRGVATLLLDQLAVRAGDRGITRLVSGAGRHFAADPLRDARQVVADQSGLHGLLAPRAVAVVGADGRRNGAGHETLRAIRDYGFGGRLYAVNASGRPVCGALGYRTVAELPAPVDLLVDADPARDVVQVINDAGLLGSRAVILAGIGPPTRRQRDEIVRAAGDRGVRLLGPASLGVLNTDPRVRLNASLFPERAPHGGLALATRSGAMGVALLAAAARDHCGVSTLVTLGDEMDLTAADLFTHWFDDPETRTVALSPESFADPVRLAEAARALGRRKPVLALTGSAALPSGEDLGVIRTTSLHEVMATARVLDGQPLPAGNRLAIVSSAGGLTAHVASLARAHGFRAGPIGDLAHAMFPGLSSPEAGSVADLGEDASPVRIAEATAAVSAGADALLVLLVSTRANVLHAEVSALAPVLDARPRLPVVVVVIGAADSLHQLGRRDAPVVRDPDQAVRALAHARDYAAWRRQPLGSPPVRAGYGTGRSPASPALAAGHG